MLYGEEVIQIGCDPKADSTINLLGGEPLRPVMNYMRERGRGNRRNWKTFHVKDSEAFSVLKQAVRHRDLGVPEEELLRHSSFWRI